MLTHIRPVSPAPGLRERRQAPLEKVHTQGLGQVDSEGRWAVHSWGGRSALSEFRCRTAGVQSKEAVCARELKTSR